jgi:hypothetical protein
MYIIQDNHSAPGLGRTLKAGKLALGGTNPTWLGRRVGRSLKTGQLALGGINPTWA